MMLSKLIPFNESIDLNTPHLKYIELPLDKNVQCETLFKIIGNPLTFGFEPLARICGCKYIWWNPERHIIQIWSEDSLAMDNAINILNYSIKKHSENEIRFGTFNDRVLYGLDEIV